MDSQAFAASPRSHETDAPIPQVGLGTSSVHPETTSSAFELAARLGYDGVELMVGVEKTSTDIDYVAKLQEYHQLPILSIHAPCLVITQKVWSKDHWEKLRITCQAAQRFGSEVVVVHPPFRWQKDYADGFEKGIRQLSEETGIILAVENMYPWRVPGAVIQGYLPSWDPTNYSYDALTLDLSHASTSQMRAIDFVDAWGPRLRHVHLTDGNGSAIDEHLFPGQGDQEAWSLVETLAARGYPGHIVHEISTRSATSSAEREQQLGECLELTRHHLRVGAQRRDRTVQVWQNSSSPAPRGHDSQTPAEDA